MTERMLMLLLAQVVKLATPLLIAALGETMAESTGVVILALDGIIMLSAMVAFAVNFSTASLLLGIVAGALIGLGLAAVFALIAVNQERDQYATGLIIGTLAIGIANYLGNPFIGKTAGTMPDLPILNGVPVFGGFLNQSLFTYFSYLAVALIAYYLYRTRPGITTRAVGANVEAAIRRGLPTKRIQVLAVLAAGLMAGLAGAAFTLDTKPGWTQNQTLGWGWLALTIVIFGQRNPLCVTVGAYLFTFLSAATIVQIFFPVLPAQLTGVAPYVMMLVVLVIASFWQRSRQRRLA